MHLPSDGQILGRGMTTLAWVITPSKMITLFKSKNLAIA